MPGYRDSLGFKFLQATKHDRLELFRRERENIAPAPWFKVYPEAPKVPLPKPSFGAENFWKALIERRSIRKYTRQALSLDEISLLCFAAQGITAQAERYLLRTAPSAGALYPVETYLFVNRALDLTPGIYHLEVQDFVLEELAQGEFGQALAEASLSQYMCAKAPLVFVWSVIPRRTMSKYGSRGVRYIFMDVAHICQNVLLAATAMGLGACPIGAFFDDEVNQILELDGEEETVVYMASVGYPAE
ncbi:SagB-type dehydrogenase domain protein [Thermodesulfatator indicus DSM 15286]|uniref:SagB-type dehydrogenase domain protein n=1 Tax=Thermodesulfatator indicus (strain DSM 15286 / JCM 11887 / CIR29812) TaxID=667014 RepID=F8A875_THEID|nr:SagB/ThcOx family dehydrogenase [Thermodesulfatator indicus]AEH44407.1 SagB-type dehydrogenase domain protein [Thermodesulfatator indicus DSM 15286]